MMRSAAAARTADVPDAAAAPRRANLLALRFDPETERAFQDDQFARTLRQVRFAYFVGGLFILAGGTVMTQMPGVEREITMGVTALVALSNFLVTAATYAPWYRRWRHLVIAVPGLAFAAGAAALIVAMPIFDVMMSLYIADIIIFIYAFAISRQGFLQAAAIALVVIAATFTASLVMLVPQAPLYSIHIWNAFLTAVLAGWLLEHYIRRDFLGRTALARERETSERLRLELEHELEVGRRIQRGFLPRRLPSCNGYHIDAVFTPARQVAGDFYDAFPLPDTRRVGLIVADVCGKGVGAALFMALVRTQLRMLLVRNFRDGGEPESALVATVTAVNEYIATTHEDQDMFATVFAAVLDPDPHELVYVNAGHEPPAVMRRAGIGERLAPTGPAVGLMPGMEFRARTLRLDPGDALLAFTDGVSDARDPEGASFGEDRLLALLGENGAGPDLAVITAALTEHMRGADAFDDVTLLSLQRA